LANPLVGMLDRQSARDYLYSRCADSKNSLTQKLQFADFFAATSYAAKRKKKWRIFRAVRRLRSGRARLLWCFVVWPEEDSQLPD
jgi:hypothetical protein